MGFTGSERVTVAARQRALTVEPATNERGARRTPARHSVARCPGVTCPWRFQDDSSHRRGAKRTDSARTWATEAVGRRIDATVLVVGNYRPTIATVRSLGRAGCRLVVGCPPVRSYAEKSRHVEEAWAHPPLEDAAFATALLAFLAARPDIDAIFPVSGLAIMRLCELHGQLPRPLPVAMPDPRLVHICDDKTALLDVAERVGVPYPAWMVVPGSPGLKDATARVGFPCVVKPAVAERRLFGEKALILRDPAALETRLAAWPEDDGELLVQRFVEGLRHNLHLVAQSGRLLRCLDTLSLRTQRLNGSGLTVSSVSVPTPPAMRAWCAKLLEAIDYSGIGCLQFLDDQERGEVAFLELNPRMAAGSGVAPYCGLDLPRHALELALGLPVEPDSSPDAYRMGVRYAWTEGDLAGLATTLRQGDIGAGDAVAWLGRSLHDALAADIHAGWDWGDMGPTLAIYRRRVGLAPG
jgi:predicted ATP-grasp superfamily ATP-dependent carboligase